MSREPVDFPIAMCQEEWKGRWSRGFSISLAVHLLVVVFMAWPSKPVFVKPNLLARGMGGTATLISTPLYVPQDLRIQPELRPAQLSLPVARPSRKLKVTHKRHNVLEEDKPKDQAEVGSREGSSVDGPAFGDEVKPALPLDFQEPRIHRSELPSGVQGDVIVEITIDEEGKVTEERLLQGLGHGIDEKVIAAVHDWHFRPATRNGVAIPSKHDVHFHFPS